MTDLSNLNNLDAMLSNLQNASTSVLNKDIIVRAEDIPDESYEKVDWDSIFWEPQPGNTYKIKFLPNIGSEDGDVVHRTVYTRLPDPARRGKTMHYVSQGRGCPVLELFFRLHELKKGGDAVAEAKIKKYLKRSQQACCKVQILESPIKAEIGAIRLFRFQSAGNNATIVELINTKVNPPIAGMTKSNIFNIFGSDVLAIKCTEQVYEGVKGRSFQGSMWLNVTEGATLIRADESAYKFSANDLNPDGSFKVESLPMIKEFMQKLVDPSIDIHKYFSYRSVEEATTEEERDWMQKKLDKVNEIIDVIETKSLQEIATYGRTEKSSTDKTVKDINKESIPEQLQGVMGAQPVSQTIKQDSDMSAIDNILNS